MNELHCCTFYHKHFHLFNWCKLQLVFPLAVCSHAESYLNFILFFVVQFVMHIPWIIHKVWSKGNEWITDVIKPINAIGSARFSQSTETYWSDGQQMHLCVQTEWLLRRHVAPPHPSQWHHRKTKMIWSALRFIVLSWICFVVFVLWVCVCETDHNCSWANIQYELALMYVDKCSAVPLSSVRQNTWNNKWPHRQLPRAPPPPPPSTHTHTHGLLFVCRHVHAFTHTCQLCHRYKSSNRPHKHI